MSLIVNTNLGSLNAQRSLNSSSTELRTAMERLSSGKRINSAADDAAGFAIAERMNAQIRGLNMAIKNAGDGLAMIETIEASAQTVTDILQRIRELGLQALNGTVSEKDREYIQAEVESLLLEIDRLASDTQFNGEEILHITNRGDKKSIQVGTEAGQTVDFNVLGFDTLWFGGGTSGFALLSDSPALIGPSTSPPSSTSDIDFNIVANGESFVIDAAAGDSAKDIVSKVNASAIDSGVFARSLAAARLETTDGSDQTISLNVNGVSTGNFILGFDGDPAEDAVMAIAEQTGVYAFSVDGGVDLVTFDGRNIEIELETSNSVSVVPLLTSNTPVTIDGTGNDSVTVTGRIKLMSSLEFSVERVGSSAPEFFDLDSIALEGTVNLASHAAITSFFDSEFGQDNFLRNIDMTYAPETAVAVASWSIEQASHNRAYYGALQNRLEYTVSNLTGISLYTASALSKIQDADYAVESARLSKAQILQQSAIAMLAQANASSQLAVTLIR